jgi:hypothetical protein
MVTVFRVLTVGFLVYLAVDLLNPFVPGVFSLECDQLFVDGAIRDKTPGPELDDVELPRQRFALVTRQIPHRPGGIGPGQQTASLSHQQAPRRGHGLVARLPVAVDDDALA